jgi:dTDP-4-dehydrorhamnose 3,5-epimerase
MAHRRSTVPEEVEPVKPLSIEGAWLISPTVHRDARGEFLELYKSTAFVDVTGQTFDLRQASISVSNKGVVRGIHYAVPGQAKYVTCVRGAVLDVVVDIRPGSPTFGQFESVQLDDVQRRAVYLSGDLGHGFCALTDTATMVYLQSTLYDPDTERTLDPTDSDLGIDWPANIPQLSQRDLNAPTIAQALDQELLPIYQGSI